MSVEDIKNNIDKLSKTDQVRIYLYINVIIEKYRAENNNSLNRTIYYLQNTDKDREYKRKNYKKKRDTQNTTENFIT